MKKLLALLLPLALAVGSSALRADELVPYLDAPIVGTVLDVKDVEHYTYLLLRTQEGEIWAAVTTAPIVKGSRVTIISYSRMDGFESPTLGRTFERIVFGRLADNDVIANPPGPTTPKGAPPPPSDEVHAGVRGHGADPHGMAAMHAMAGQVPDIEPINLAKPEGPHARTIAQVIAGAAALKDTPVTVRGQVVKFTADVMGKNWAHLRDGTGSATDGTNDVLVVTMSEAKVGDVVQAKGIVRTDRDFGSGYAYKVLIDEATLQK